ncbi:MAG: energy-coupling factor transporter transmembrane component T [Anaerolineales bacterium]|jgi:energy-coupling factor transport system permease protein
MTAAPDWYVERESWLHSADARVKLAMVACGLAFFLTVQNATLELLGLLTLVGAYGSARLPRSSVSGVLRVLLPVSIFMAILRGLLAPEGNVMVAWGWLRLTDGGLAAGAALGLRLLAVGLLVFLWLHTTRPSAMIQSLVRLGLPYSWGLTLALAMRYIPLLQRSFQSILEAQQARGLLLESTVGLARVRALMPVFVAMVISGFRGSQQVAVALEARGLGASGVKRSDWRPLRFRRRDGVYLIALLGATAAWLALRFGAGVGTNPLGWW